MHVTTAARTTAVVAAGALAASVAPTVPAHAAAPAWRVVRTYDNGKYDSLDGVVALSRKDAWAFGGGDRKKGDFNRPLAYRWNGKTWNGSPLPAGLTGQLHGGSASSPSNVWAYGSRSEAGGTGGPYVLRWNGRKWAVAKRFKDGYITGVTALGPSNVWVFGAPGADKGVGTWHFNGRTWTALKNPPALIARATYSSPSNVWANARGLNGDSRTIVRFDGKRWKVVPTGRLLPPDVHSPSGPTQHVYVGTPLVRSAKEVWVSATVDRYGPAPKYTRTTTPLLLRWNGKAWQKFAAPAGRSIAQVVPDGRGGLWASQWTGGDRMALRHRSAAGKWTTAAITGTGGRVPQVYGMALFPGTRSVLGAGQLSVPGGHTSDGALFYFKG